MTTKEYIRQQISVYKNYILSSLSNEEAYVRKLYRSECHHELDLSRPILFSEKLQWLKINDHKEIYHTMVDKFDCKSLINNIIGENYTIPTLGIWNSFEEIDFDLLPNRFILKPTFDSGTYYICKDKNNIDLKQVKHRLYKYWKTGFYYQSKEWPYKGLKRRIMAEPLLKDDNCPYLRDFKFYCFNGEPKIFYITSDKGGNLPTRENFFDIQGNPLEIEDVHYSKNPVAAPSLPVHLDKMVELSRSLSKGTYHLRVDFYEINGKVYCGELTFFERGGFCEFVPEEWNKTLGDWIKLPIDK